LSSNSVVADADQVQASGGAEATQENEEEEGKQILLFSLFPSQ
jgi:hypothetical protein